MLRVPKPLGKFYADRGPHLAAMIAYFALLSFVPLLFLTISALSLAGRPDESSYLVTELKRAFPGSSISSIVHTVTEIQKHATALGIIGGAALLWTSLSLFSVLESAFNIVYGRPNRPFIHGKSLALALLVGTLVTLFVALLVGSFGVQGLKDWAPGFIDNYIVAYVLSVAVSTLGVFVFIVSIYYVLTNVRLGLRDVLPGAIFATVLLEASFQILPIFLRYAELNPVLKAFGSPAILLVWLYFMANVLIFGAELNWWRQYGREAPPEEAPTGFA